MQALSQAARSRNANSLVLPTCKAVTASTCHRNDPLAVPQDLRTHHVQCISWTRRSKTLQVP